MIGHTVVLIIITYGTGPLKITLTDYHHPVEFNPFRLEFIPTSDLFSCMRD